MYLLDTNALIILLREELAGAALTESSMEILSTERHLFASIVSLWEIAIKVKINKLDLNASLTEIEEELLQQDITLLPLKSSYIDKTLELPLMSDHKDPFDRLILATSIVEKFFPMTVIIKVGYHIQKF